MIVPARLVVMGVSGVGKSTVGRALSERLGVDFAEGDDFHSAASVARMAAGIALTDDDRAPWLERIGRWLGERQEGGVASCSSLRRAYRDRIRRLCPDVAFVHLAAGASLVRERVASRSGHYMPASLVDSQFEALEELAPDEVGIRLDASEEPAQLVERASAFAQRLGSSSMLPVVGEPAVGGPRETRIWLSTPSSFTARGFRRAAQAMGESASGDRFDGG